MAPSTPQGGSAMSSRLLSMKFMQRAAATSVAPSPASASASDGGSAKRRKLNSGSAGGSPAAVAPAAGDPFSQVHVKAALEELEAKRRAAVDRRAAELSDSHWVLDVPAVPARGAKGSAGKPPLNIVYVGYGDIDRAEGNDKGSDGEDGEPEYEDTQDKVQVGRRITGNYKKKDGKERNQGSNSDSSDEDSSGEEGSVSGSSDEEGSRPRNAPRHGKGAGSAKAGGAQAGKAKKDVKLSRLTSISGAGGNTAPQSFGPKTMKCYACGAAGHRAIDRECPKNRNSRKRRAN